jgi:hypothetical protein
MQKPEKRRVSDRNWQDETGKLIETIMSPTTLSRFVLRVRKLDKLDNSVSWRQVTLICKRIPFLPAPFPALQPRSLQSFPAFRSSSYFPITFFCSCAVIYILLFILVSIFHLFRNQTSSKHAFLIHHSFLLPSRPCGFFSHA